MVSEYFCLLGAVFVRRIDVGFEVCGRPGEAVRVHGCALARSPGFRKFHGYGVVSSAVHAHGGRDDRAVFAVVSVKLCSAEQVQVTSDRMPATLIRLTP